MRKNRVLRDIALWLGLWLPVWVVIIPLAHWAGMPYGAKSAFTLFGILMIGEIADAIEEEVRDHWHMARLRELDDERPLQRTDYCRIELYGGGRVGAQHLADALNRQLRADAR